MSNQKGVYRQEKASYNRNVEACLKRDNYTCQVCGSEKELNVHHKDKKGHHIEKYEANDELSNLITVCQRCHVNLHYDVLERTEDMLNLRLEGKSHTEIGRVYGITRQRVQQILKRHPVSRKYVLNGPEASKDGDRGRLKGLLDKIVLKVKKFV